MNWANTKNTQVLPLDQVPVLKSDDFIRDMKTLIASGKRLVLFFAGPGNQPGTPGNQPGTPGNQPGTPGNQPDNQHETRHVVYAVFADDDNSFLHIACSHFSKGNRSYESLGKDYPCFYLYEREVFEDSGILPPGILPPGILPPGHPSLNPVRKIFGSGKNTTDTEIFDFSVIDGEEVHEVGVGPVHAGVIEPGHFRFSCLGETVYNLEIQLGYQHRGIERLMVDETREAFRIHLAGSIAGDTVIGHSLAYAQVFESLTGSEVSSRAHAIRGIALEIERAAVHTGDLAALSNDIAYAPGASVFGAIRTILINTFLAMCGSRFARTLIREGGVDYDISLELVTLIKKNCAIVKKKIDRMCSVLFSSPGVLSRFETTGTVSTADARQLGLVGPAARASGISLDVRSDHPHGIYAITPFHKITLSTGDVFARAYIRYIEISRSLEYIDELLDNLPEGNLFAPASGNVQHSSIVVSLVEAWRGEIAHCVITDAGGKFLRYKIKDPSFNNWRGLELALRQNGISDFPLCNKSFNLSYCGFDL